LQLSDVLSLIVDIVTGFFKLRSQLLDIRLLTIDLVFIAYNGWPQTRLLSSQGLVALVALELDSSDMGHLFTKSCAFGDMLINRNGQVMDLVLLRF